MSQYKKNKVSQLFTVNGSTSTAGSGMTLTSDLTLGSSNGSVGVSFIRIPKGMKLKVWEKGIQSTVSTDTVSIQYTHAGQSTTPAGFYTVDKSGMGGGAGAGYNNIEKRRPVVLNGFTGNEAVQFVSGNSATSISYEIEITNE